ncbi:alpha/beta hydrolase [Williamsia sp. R60]
MTPDDVIKRQKPMSRNALTRWVYGAADPTVTMETGAVDRTSHSISLRVYRPRGKQTTRPRPVIVYFHGGGWALGNLDSGTWLCSRVAAATDAVVVAVDYRLAPQHPWPAGPEDCYAAVMDIANRAAEFGIDPTRLAVMGDSAGGNLAAAVCLMSRDRSGPAIVHQTLLYPATDLRWQSASADLNANAPVLGKSDLFAFRNWYAPREETWTDPYLSPLLADRHVGLPPALIQVADNDPLRDDGANYAAKLRDAHVPVRFTEYVASPHGYFGFPNICRAAPQALAEICAEQRAALY